MRTMLAILVAVTVGVGCQERSVSPPPRPTGVPAAAIWGGGADGGDWLHCTPVRVGFYDCSIYWDFDGSLKAKGSYALRKVTWDANQGAPAYSEADSTSEVNFRFFDGILVHLEGDLALAPHGVIDFPFGDGHGKRQQFEMGVPQGPEEQY